MAGMYLVFDFYRGNQYLRKGGRGLFTEEGAFYTNAIYHFDKWGGNYPHSFQKFGVKLLILGNTTIPPIRYIPDPRLKDRTAIEGVYLKYVWLKARNK